tara:strand:+ start:846 stop:1991 length:1146 start_codon:yes stop_codon:yes gene_type:complete
MKPYDIINNITEDMLCNNLKDNYCLVHFPDNIRYDATLAKRTFVFTTDKHHMAGLPHSPRPAKDRNYFFHNGDWIYGFTTPYTLRKHVKYNIFQHSWEPINLELDKFFWDFVKVPQDTYGLWGDTKHKDYTAVVLHSEKNSKDIDLLEKDSVKHVHWFSHAYLCSEFYFKHYQKLNIVKNYKTRPIKHKWLCANRLLRQHRVNLLEQIDITKGCYSLLNPDPNGLQYNGPIPKRSFDDHSNHSAEICINKLTPWNTSFLHIVSETVWQEKIHFTEKIFKPIVLHQPFVVAQAPGSLEYLRSYGFKTFDNWWDEDYDKIDDPSKRLSAVAKIINDIGRKDISELETLRMEMASVLEHNFRHFYENIPAIVLQELDTNLRLLN